ncbi:hypothetical protein DPV78_001940 [Talaromyces pinophilus]|nr:hypothetical protein DPV78_001940 [Talaromyces pinophilus]
MTRGNQREKARAKNLEKAAKTKTKNTMSGNEFAREKERVAAIMQEKQKKGNDSITGDFDSVFCLPLERKAAEAAAGGKK